MSCFSGAATILVIEVTLSVVMSSAATSLVTVRVRMCCRSEIVESGPRTLQVSLSVSPSGFRMDQRALSSSVPLGDGGSRRATKVCEKSLSTGNQLDTEIQHQSTLVSNSAVKGRHRRCAQARGGKRGSQISPMQVGTP